MRGSCGIASPIFLHDYHLTPNVPFCIVPGFMYRILKTLRQNRLGHSKGGRFTFFVYYVEFCLCVMVYLKLRVPRGSLLLVCVVQFEFLCLPTSDCVSVYFIYQEH